MSSLFENKHFLSKKTNMYPFYLEENFQEVYLVLSCSCKDQETINPGLEKLLHKMKNVGYIALKMSRWIL